MLHVHILLIASLGAGHMAQDQHKGRIAIREGAHHPGAAADLPVEPLNHIVDADSCPMLIGELTMVNVSSTSSCTFFAASFSFISRSWAITSSAFSRAAFLEAVPIDKKVL